MELAGVTGGNLLRYFAQVLIVVSATEIGLRLTRPSAARVRLAGWRIAVAICVLLPLVPLRQTSLAATAASPIILHLDLTTTGAIAATLARLWMWQAEAGLLAIAAWLTTAAATRSWLLLAGIVVRATWLGLGFRRLAQLRAESTPFADVDADLESLQRLIAPNVTATVRWHDDVTQPVTFGLLRPIVLLPRRITDLPRDARRAILCHELLHVARRDWAWTLVEEALQTALWWHPAIWWALAQLHLHREETIDAEVVAITDARQSYMRALIVFAGAATPAAPVVPFIRRRHLAARLEQLVQEVPMSRVRLTSAIAVLGVIIAAASWASVSALPLQKTSAQRSDQKADQPLKAEQVDTKPRLITEVKPVYPRDAFAARIQGEVEVMIRVNKNGTVSDAHVTRSIPALDQAALDAVRQWKFEPATLKGKPVDVLCSILTRFTMK